MMPALLTRMSTRAERGGRLLDQPRGDGAVGQIAGDDRGPAAERGHARRGLGGRVPVAVTGDVGARLGERHGQRRPDPGARARHQRALPVEAKEIGGHRAIARRYFWLASRPDPAWSNPGWTLTTPNLRSTTSRWAAIIQMKLIPWPGAETLGW